MYYTIYNYITEGACIRRSAHQGSGHTPRCCVDTTVQLLPYSIFARRRGGGEGGSGAGDRSILFRPRSGRVPITPIYPTQRVNYYHN